MGARCPTFSNNSLNSLIYFHYALCFVCVHMWSMFTSFSQNILNQKILQHQISQSKVALCLKIIKSNAMVKALVTFSYLFHNFKTLSICPIRILDPFFTIENFQIFKKLSFAPSLIIKSHIPFIEPNDLYSIISRF